MTEKAGLKVFRFEDVPWTHRVRFDGRPHRARIYIDDQENGIRLSLVDYPVGSVEPRHVHPGTHATTVVKGRAIIDGLTLGCLDCILGPGGEPHGPLEYPDGCNLFSAFQGSNDHSEVQQLGTEKHYRLVQHSKVPYEGGTPEGLQSKVLVDRGAGPLRLRALHFARGSVDPGRTSPDMEAAMIVKGSARIEGETFGVWDLIYTPKGAARCSIEFPDGATLLAVTMRTAA